MQHKLRTWSWVLSANFSEGLPYTIINTMLVALLADMGCSNGTAAMIPSLLALPWMWKFAWSPFVDTRGTKRTWMLLTQLVMTVIFVCIALSLQASWWLPVVVTGSALAAIASATYDVSCDGYYMLALPQQEQAFFVGIRSTAYRLGMLFASGFLIILAKDGTPEAWQKTFLITAGLMLALVLLHKYLLPVVEKSAPSAEESSAAPKEGIVSVLRSFVQLHQGRELAFMLCFILFYRLGEAFLSKVTILFLKDNMENGGIGLNNEQYGYLYGTFGTLALVIGGIVGGICISRWGLRKCLIPMVLALDIPDLLYVWMASDLSTFHSQLSTTGICISLEQFGYGFGFTAFTVYLLECAKGPFQTSHYAILTALMAFGLMIPSTLSGYVQEALQSYSLYFIIACLLTLPGIALSVWYVVKDS